MIHYLCTIIVIDYVSLTYGLLFVQQIPTAFVKHFNGFVPEKAILRDSVGRVWHVEVGQIGKNVYFLKGWQQFLTDNLVEEGDLFVFQYDGSYIFDFKLYGTTGCQKKDSEVNVDVNKKKFFVKGEEDVEEIERNEEQEEEEEEEEEPQSKSSNKGVVVFKRKYSGRGPRSIGRKCYYQLCNSFLSLRFFHFFFACVHAHIYSFAFFNI